MIRYEPRSWLNVVVRVKGTVLRRVALRTLLVAAMAATVAWLKNARGIDLSIPVIVHSIVGVALGLLLVFRTNASYDRYWEGRKLVGGMVNTCRDLGRQVASYLPDDQEARERAAGLIIAFYATIRRYLRGERDLPELAGVLSADDLRELDRRRAQPLGVAQRLTDLLVDRARRGTLSEERLRTLDSNITTMIGLWGGAERIVATPVPFAYAHHIKVFLTGFCFTLPFALVGTIHWFAVVGAAAVAFGMFGIDEIGVEIEDPFGYDDNDLPMDDIGGRIATDVYQVLSVAPPSDEG